MRTSALCFLGARWLVAQALGCAVWQMSQGVGRGGHSWVSSGEEENQSTTQQVRISEELPPLPAALK